MAPSDDERSRPLASPVPESATPAGDVPTLREAATPSLSALPPLDEKALQAGTTVGRYMVLHRVGVGGMGVVYAAHDPELERKVALKLLLAPISEHRERLLREAQALARISHPNVISVFDAGLWADRLFIAMELVEGPTLKSWLAQHERSWREVLDAFQMAGRGLAAAHAAGVVHRDFKPENVLVGEDGRVRVMDFGLAHAPASEGEPAAPGVIEGTPGYMSPEQHRGEPTDARSDQFSFCVALYEALYGARPFDKATSGPVRPPPRGSRAPARLFRALQRGLSAKAEDRFPSMEALLGALEVRPVAARRLVLAGAAVLLLGGVGIVAQVRRANSQVCKGAERKLAGVWDAARGQEIEKAFLATGKPYAAGAFAGLRRELDAYAASWVGMHTDACEATRLRKEQPEDVLSLRMVCLDRRLDELRALTALLSQADASVMEKSVQAAGALSRIEACADVDALRARVRPPDDPKVRAQVETLRGRLTEAKAQLDATRFKQAVQLAQEVVDAARPLAHRPLNAEALALLGLAQLKAGDHAAAEKSFSEAMLEAEASRHDQEAAQIWVRLVDAAQVQAHFDDMEERTRRAQAALERVGGSDELSARLLSSIGRARLLQGKLPEALELQRKALALREKLYGPEHPEVAASLLAVSKVLQEQGNLAEARATAQRSLAIREKLYGPNHPEVAASLNGLGNVELLADDSAAAIKLYERALAIQESKLGPEHLDLAGILTNLATAKGNLGRNEEAVALQRRAVGLYEKALGPEHPLLASALLSLGIHLLDLGKQDDAAPYFERCRDIYLKALGPEHPDLIYPLSYLGILRLSTGEFSRACESLGDALARSERAMGKDNPSTMEIRITYGTALTRAQRFREAQGQLEQALAYFEGLTGAETRRGGEAHLVLGQLELARGRRQEATRHFEATRASFERANSTEHAAVAGALTGLAELRQAERAPEQAEALARQAVAIWEKISGPDFPDIADALVVMGQAALSRGKPEEARTALERALALRESHHAPPADLGRTRFALARALEGASRARAVELARLAQADFARAEANHRDAAAEVKRWLAARR